VTPTNTKDRESAEEVESLRSKLAEAEEKLADALEVISAIRSGEVDAVVVSRADGDQIFTLRGAEYAYRALVEAMNEGAGTLGADGTILYCNQRFSDLLGIQLEQIIGRPIKGLMKESDDDLLRALVERALLGTPAKFEVEMVAADGRSIPTLVSLSKMKIEEPAALCMVVTDLTESRQWEELVTAGRLATSILESSAEAIAVCDRDGNIVSVNDALKRLHGSNPILEHFDRAFPLKIQVVGHPASCFSISSALSKSIRGQEVSFCRENGAEFSLLLSSGHIFDNGGVAGCVLTLTDITGRKRVEQALLQSEKLAAVGRLAASIAHEINNPLESVTNVLYLARGVETISEIRDYLDVADQELRRVAAITSQTLRFHKQSTKPMEIGCEELIDSVLSVYQGRLANSNVTVYKRERATRRISCFEGEIRQVLSNLVGNSIDAMGPGGGHLLLRSSEGHDKLSRKGIFLTVADDGPGMSRETALRVFEPFFTTKGFSGTGLGLWVSQEILQRHRGLLVLRSSQRPKRSGTIVRIFLPFAAAAR
jgi:PAS domain S-box-containing protein